MAKRASQSDMGRDRKGYGCVKNLNWEADSLMRVTLDHESPLYKVIYNQRTSTERINGQSEAMGIKRPNARNGRSVANLNTLTYILIKSKALQRAHPIQCLALEHPLVEVDRQRNLVLTCPQQGRLALEAESPAWFAWLETRAAFRFVGQQGHFTAHREVDRVPNGA